MTEVKSVTLVADGVARFPDAPTERGARHLRELATMARAGQTALVVFVAQHPEARIVTPNVSTDPDFGEALRDARRAGVKILAYACDVRRMGISITRRIPVTLPTPTRPRHR